MKSSLRWLSSDASPVPGVLNYQRIVTLKRTQHLFIHFVFHSFSYMQKLGNFGFAFKRGIVTHQNIFLFPHFGSLLGTI